LFSGEIIVSIIEREASPKTSLEFLIDLNRGRISAVDHGESLGMVVSSGGRIDHCDIPGTQEVVAPNRESTIRCVVAGGDARGVRYEAKVRRRSADLQERRWSAPPDWEIKGFAWSPDSKSIAILLENERTDFRPVGLLSMITGHPISLHSFGVTLLSSQLDHELKLPLIRKNSPAGWARVDWAE